MPQAPLALDLTVTCPFRAITGLPCPFCGGTRAFEHAATLDSSFMDYGAVWVFAAIVAAIAIAALLITRAVNRSAYEATRSWARGLSWQVTVGSAVLLVLVAWAYALAHRGTIVN